MKTLDKVLQTSRPVSVLCLKEGMSQISRCLHYRPGCETTSSTPVEPAGPIPVYVSVPL